ncbi:MAG: hypothetical protein WD042_20205 [Phycisphaeraceae bacterium]
MSLHALARYIKADARTRRRIIHDQKYPADFQTVYYQPARAAICEFICSSFADMEAIVKVIESLHSRPANNDYESHRWPNNVEAIEAFLEVHEELDLQSLQPRSMHTDLPKLSIGGVVLSVFPEIALRGRHKKASKAAGGIALMFSKDDRFGLDDHSGKASAHLVQQLVGEVFADREAVPAACSVIDVFGGSQYCAPTTSKRLREEIALACDEIAHTWPYV